MTGDLKTQLRAGPDAPARAREAIREQIGSLLSAGRLSALLTVVSELVANSVVHGPGGPIQLSVEVSENGTVLGRVADEGLGRVAIREDTDPSEGGMGLKLVDAYTDRWGVEEGTSNVWFEVAPRRFSPRVL